MRNTIMGIRLGKAPVIFESMQEAAGVAKVGSGTVRDYVNNGKQTTSGWCFDYELEENKKNA
jgi:serine/threonine protein kinase HipA of HipAB toxin-antitoxin module